MLTAASAAASYSAVPSSKQCISSHPISYNLTPRSRRQQVLDAHRGERGRLVQRRSVLEAVLGLQARRVPGHILRDPRAGVSGGSAGSRREDWVSMQC